MHEYDTSQPVTFEAQSAPEVVETVEIEGQPVAIVRYATLTMPTADSAPVFGRTDEFYAMPADGQVHTLSLCFYVRAGQHHAAGDAVGGRTVAPVNGRELARCSTVKAAIKSARERIERDRLYAQYAPVAVANIDSHTRQGFEALDADAEIEPGDLVVVVSHSKYRTGVAVKVTKTRVECLAATPTGRVANGATRTKGTQVRLLRKATAAPVVEAATRQAAPGDEAVCAHDDRAIVADADGVWRHDDGYRSCFVDSTTDPRMAVPAPVAPAAPVGEQTTPAAPDEPGGLSRVDLLVLPHGARVEVLLATSTDGPGIDPRGGWVPATVDGVAESLNGEINLWAVVDYPAGLSGRNGERTHWEHFTASGRNVRAAGEPGPAEASLEGFAPADDAEDQGDGPAPVAATRAALLVELLGEQALRSVDDLDPAALRAIADQVERRRAGHVTEIEVDGAGHFGWRCLLGDADQTGLEVGEAAYAAATAHGPLVADSPFAQRPVIVHEGRADNEHGVPRWALDGSLRPESYDDDDDDGWIVAGYAHTTEVDVGDVVGAQAWAAAVMTRASESRGDGAVTVARWEHHRDSYGEWWEPVTR